MRQRNNTLSAEIELAAAATIVREINGQFLTDQQVMPAAVGFQGFGFCRGAAQIVSPVWAHVVFRCHDPVYDGTGEGCLTCACAGSGG